MFVGANNSRIGGGGCHGTADLFAVGAGVVGPGVTDGHDVGIGVMEGNGDKDGAGVVAFVGEGVFSVFFCRGDFMSTHPFSTFSLDFVGFVLGSFVMLG